MRILLSIFVSSMHWWNEDLKTIVNNFVSLSVVSSIQIICAILLATIAINTSNKYVP